MSMRRALVLLLLGAGLLVFLTPWGGVISQELTHVIVTNFPPIQRIEGAVQIDEPVHLSKLVSFSEVTVPPVKRSESTRLLEVGTLVTEGFPNVVLSLHGVVKGSVTDVGDVGAILIPVQQSIQEAFFEQGQFHFSLEVVATGVSSKTPYFASTQPRYPIGFQAYRVFLYNSTDKAVTVSLFSYLTS